MAVPRTLHIGRPCMRCAPSCIRGPGGAGLSPCRGLGEEGGGGRGSRASCWGGGGVWGGMRRPRQGPMHGCWVWGAGPPPCAFSPRWGDAGHLCACQR